VRSVQAVALARDADGGPEELRVLMEGDGRTGVLTISTRARPELNTLKLCGTKMTIEVNLNNMTLVRRREYDVPKIIGKSLPNIDESYQLLTQLGANTVNFIRGKIRYYPGMKTLIARFYDAIRRGEDPPVSIEAGGDVVRVTEQIWSVLATPSDEDESRTLSIAMEGGR
jgi:predicted dehydrogenase